jgi:cell division septum initiation protein DivIVA
MEPLSFARSLRGYDVQEVDRKVTELQGQLVELTEALTQSRDTNTELRLSVIKQVEQASAEAAVVLNHARSEAVRVRESAVAESNSILEKTRNEEKRILSDASLLREKAKEDQDSIAESAKDVTRVAREQADEIVANGTEKSASLRADAAVFKEEALRRAREIGDELRLKKVELDRTEIEIREQADAYALRVYREADEYARSSERRSLDTEKQAEEILHQARVSSRENTANSLATSRHYLEEALGIVNSIFSDVSGSLQGVQRIRQILEDSVDRIGTNEVSGPTISSAPEQKDSQGIQA